MAESQTLGKLLVELFVDDDQFKGKLKGAATRLDQTGRTMTAFANKIQNVATVAVKGFAVALAGVTTASVLVGASFEKQITKVAVLAGGGQEAMDALAAKARELGAATTFSATEAAGAMESLAQAGLSTKDILTATDAALAMAAASQGSLATATAVTAATMSTFGLHAEDATRIADVFTKTLNVSQFDMEELAHALQFAGPIAASFGMSLEETSAALAMFRDLGLDGAKAGTALRMALSQAVTISDVAAQTLEGLGLTAADISPETHNFGEILRAIGEKGITATQAIKIFGTESGGAVAQLAKQVMDGSKSFDQLVADLHTSQGIAAETAEAMTATVAGAFEEASGAFEELLLSAFDTYGVPLRALLLQVAEVIDTVTARFQAARGRIGGGMTALLGDLTEWLDDNQQRIATTFVDFTDAVIAVASALERIVPLLDEMALIVATVFIASRVTSFVAALTSVIAVANAATLSFSAMGTALVAATGGVSALVAGIAVLVTGLALVALRYTSAATEAEKLDTLQRQMAANQEAVSARLTDVADRALNTTRATLQAKAEQAQAEGRLTDAMRSELEFYLKLTDEQAAAALASGELIQVGDELVRVSSVLSETGERRAWGMGALQQVASASAEKVDALQSKIALLDTVVEDAASTDLIRLDSMRKINNAAALGLITEAQATAVLKKAREEASLRSAGIDMGTNAYKDMTLSVDLVRSVSHELSEQLEIEEDKHNKLSEAVRIGQSENALNAAGKREVVDTSGEVTDALDGETKSTDDAADALAKLNSMYQQGAEFARGKAQAAQDAADDDATAQARAYDRARDDATAFYDALVVQVAEAGGDVAAIEAQRNAALLAIDDQFYTEGLAHQQAAQQARIDDERERDKERADKLRDARRRSEDALLSLRMRGASRVERVEADLAAFLVDNDALTVDERLEVQAIFAAARQDALREDLLDNTKASDGVRRAWLFTIDRIGTGWSEANQRFVLDVMVFADKAIEAMEAVGQAAAGMFGTLTGGAIPTDVQSMIDTVLGNVLGAEDDLAAQAADLREAANEAATRAAEAAAEASEEPTQANLDAALEAEQAAAEAALMAAEAERALQTFNPADQARVAAKEMADEATRFAETLAAAVGPFIAELTAQIPRIVDALIEAIPRIVRGVIRSVPDLIVAIVKALPRLVTVVLKQVPVIVEGLIKALPEILEAVIKAVPQIAVALIKTLPDIAIALIALGPRVVLALIDAFLFEFLPRLPQIAGEMILALVAKIGDVVKSLVDGLVDGLQSAFPFLFGKGKGKEEPGLLGKGKEAAEDLWNNFVGLFSGGKGASAFSGIEYVPATMRMTVHPGEAVIDRSRNATRLFGGQGPAPSGSGVGYGGGRQTIEIPIFAEGRLLEAVQVLAEARGHATVVSRSVRRAAGVKVGLNRGRFSPWTRR